MRFSAVRRRSSYRSGALESVSGRWVLSEPREDSRSESLGSPITALFLLLRHVMDAGDVCKAVTAVSAGYQVPATLSDPIRLTPSGASQPIRGYIM